MFETFISYRHIDASQVNNIAAYLKFKKVNFWIDEEQIPKGQNWRDYVSKGIIDSKSVTLFLGKEGIEGFQKQEIDHVLNLAANNSKPIIPVFLPDAPDTIIEKIHSHFGLSSKSSITLLESDVSEIEKDSENKLKLIWAFNPDSKPRELENYGINSLIRKRPKILENQTTDTDTNFLIEVEHFGEAFKDNEITFFVGTCDSQNKPELPPGALELSRHLLSEINIHKPVDGDEDKLLPSLDYAGEYYSLVKTKNELDKKVTHLVDSNSKSLPEEYLLLAQINKLRGESMWGSMKSDNLRLILTTNFDVLLECAFVENKVPFTRMVHIVSQNIIRFETFDVYNDFQISFSDAVKKGSSIIEWLNLSLNKEKTQTVNISDKNAEKKNNFEKYINLEYPVIYKMHGSVDIKNSCAITHLQYLEFLEKYYLNEIVPSPVVRAIEYSSTLILGYELLEVDFLLIKYIFKKYFKESLYKNMAICHPPNSRFNQIWPHTKQHYGSNGILVREHNTVKFLTHLLNYLK